MRQLKITQSITNRRESHTLEKYFTEVSSVPMITPIFFDPFQLLHQPQNVKVCMFCAFASITDYLKELFYHEQNPGDINECIFCNFPIWKEVK